MKRNLSNKCKKLFVVLFSNQTYYKTWQLVINLTVNCFHSTMNSSVVVINQFSLISCSLQSITNSMKGLGQ